MPLNYLSASFHIEANSRPLSRSVTHQVIGSQSPAMTEQCHDKVCPGLSANTVRLWTIQLCVAHPPRCTPIFSPLTQTVDFQSTAPKLRTMLLSFQASGTIKVRL